MLKARSDREDHDDAPFAIVLALICPQVKLEMIPNEWLPNTTRIIGDLHNIVRFAQ